MVLCTSNLPDAIVRRFLFIGHLCVVSGASDFANQE